MCTWVDQYVGISLIYCLTALKVVNKHHLWAKQFVYCFLFKKLTNCLEENKKIFTRFPHIRCCDAFRCF